MDFVFIDIWYFGMFEYAYESSGDLEPKVRIQVWLCSYMPKQNKIREIYIEITYQVMKQTMWTH